MDAVRPTLTGVPETMLWTLYARAHQAQIPGGLIEDEQAVRVFRRLDVDFDKFGKPNDLFVVRALLIDRVLRTWLRTHPEGTVVSLGEGLETQFWRVDNGRMRWLSVDLPEAIELRRDILPASDRLHHLEGSAFDPFWTEQVDRLRGVFIVAQGLFMYFDAATVEGFMRMTASVFSTFDMMFDIVPRWMSEETMQPGWTDPVYNHPPMPWGLHRNEVVPTLRGWCPRLERITLLPYRAPKGRPDFLENLADRLLPRRRRRASLVHLRIADAGRA